MPYIQVHGTDAKKYFSKVGCPAVKIGDKLLSGKMIRQEYLETAIEWVARTENKSIEGYVGTPARYERYTALVALPDGHKLGKPNTARK